MLEIGKQFFIFIHSNATLQCVSFLKNEQGFMLRIFDSMLIFSGKKVKTACAWYGIDTDLHLPDPNRHALDADPDPGKLCGSDSIQLEEIFNILRYLRATTVL
jgi:hypothetical protein